MSNKESNEFSRENIIDNKLMQAFRESLDGGNSIEASIGSLVADYQTHIDQAIEDLRETLETIEIQNVELNLARNEIEMAKKVLQVNDLLDPDKNVTDNQFIVREINFDPVYKQSGISILSYFSEIIDSRYPDSDVSVRIIQCETKVTMIIETSEGEIERVEKLLTEYGETICGKRKISDLVSDPLDILRLTNELKMAELRIENNREIIALQKGVIDSFKEIMSDAILSKNNGSMQLSLSPNITVSNVNYSFNDSVEIVNVLKKLLTDDSNDCEFIEEVKDLIEMAPNMSSQNDVGRGALWLGKVRVFVEKFCDCGVKAVKKITISAESIESIKTIGKLYNSVSVWCGAPQIPSRFLE